MADDDYGDLLPKEVWDAALRCITETPIGDVGVVHNKLVNLLREHKDHLQAKDVDYMEVVEYLVDFYVGEMENARNECRRQLDDQAGRRVKVYAGDDETFLGEGIYEGDATVYFIQAANGDLQSFTNAEEKPPPEMIPEGGRLIRMTDNPKLRLDDGRVFYGCQVWFTFLERNEGGQVCENVSKN